MAMVAASAAAGLMRITQILVTVHGLCSVILFFKFYCCYFTVMQCKLTKTIPNNYGVNDYYTISEVFPTCEDLVDVWPVPNSVLEPILTSAEYEVYVFRVTFSRPVLPRGKRPYFTLTFSTIKPLTYLPYYYRYSYGSQRSLWLYFKVSLSMKYLQ